MIVGLFYSFKRSLLTLAHAARVYTLCVQVYPIYLIMYITWDLDMMCPYIIICYPNLQKKKRA